VTSRRDALAVLFHRAEAAGWAGADPYDGLHSVAGRLAIPLGPPARLFVIQSALRWQAARAVIRPAPTVNPKGLALMLGAAIRSRAALGEKPARDRAARLVAALRARAVTVSGALAWGYPFPWQSRFFWAPAGTPNAVVTATAGWHLLAAEEESGDRDAGEMARGAARFLLNHLHWMDAEGGASSVSYTPRDQTRIVNVAGLVARLLARLGERERAARLTRFIVRSQLENGCWPYSLSARGRWQDSFHTGFLLESLLDLRAAGIEVPEPTLRRGFEAYARFFDADGGARLYSESAAPYDAHSAAQGMATYEAAVRHGTSRAITAEDPRAAARSIAEWAMRRLWIEEKSRFAYRLSARGARDDTDYARWVQAWMAFGLASVEAIATAVPKNGAGEAAQGVEVA
jgi:hypothetical protein